MIHWGLYSVPGWAERAGTIQDLWQRHGPNYYFSHNPYAEWYANTIQIRDSTAQKHHLATYRTDFPYDAFASDFDKASANVDFSRWAELFAEAKARYVVLTTKHMDGFGLWPSQVMNTYKPGYHSARDIVGDVTRAIRDRGLKMGLYYSAGYDMTFNATVIRDAASAISAIPQDSDYAEYVDRQIEELIERYHPSILWNDISYPVANDLKRLFALYYNRVPDGVVNDRWQQIRPASSLVAKTLLKAVSHALPFIWPALPSSLRRFRVPQGTVYDFATPEYATESDIVEDKWEAVRGIGPSFGNNRNEQEADLPSGDDLVRLLVDVASKNGNLLLGVGPEPNGDIPQLQQDRLLHLGRWLAVNGEAIFSTRPWQRAEGRTATNVPVRFTCNGDSMFAIVLASISPGPLIIRDLRPSDSTRVALLGVDGSLAWQHSGADLAVSVPQSVPVSPAYVFRIRPNIATSV